MRFLLPYKAQPKRWQLLVLSILLLVSMAISILPLPQIGQTGVAKAVGENWIDPSDGNQTLRVQVTISENGGKSQSNYATMFQAFYSGNVIEDDSCSQFLYLPAARYSGTHDRTYIAGTDSFATVTVQQWDEDDKLLGSPIQLWDFSGDDDHTGCSVIVLQHQTGGNATENGTIFVAVGTRPDHMIATRRSDNVEDIGTSASDWGDSNTVQSTGDGWYPFLTETSDGVIRCFWQQADTYTVKYSTCTLAANPDDDSWSAPTILADLGSASGWGTYLKPWVDGADIHFIFGTLHSINTAGYEDVWYIKFQGSDSTWRTAGGTAKTLPLDLSDAAHTPDVVYTTAANRSTVIYDIKTDTSHNPYLVFIDSTDDDAEDLHGNIYRSAYTGGAWVNTDTTIDAVRFGTHPIGTYMSGAVLREGNVDVMFAGVPDGSGNSQIQAWENVGGTWYIADGNNGTTAIAIDGKITQASPGDNFRPTTVLNGAGHFEILWFYSERYVTIDDWDAMRMAYPGFSNANFICLNKNARTDFGDLVLTTSDGETLQPAASNGQPWIQEKTDSWRALLWWNIGSAPGYTQTVFTATPVGGNWTVPAGVTSVELLVVAGGGGGGGGTGGGGGAGGIIYNAAFPVTPGSAQTVTVGSGGAGGARVRGTNGSNSVFGNQTAAGGGGGGSNYDTFNGKDGGSGGGACSTGTGGSENQTPNQGYNGGNGGAASGIYAGGGGGGSGALGQNGNSAVKAGDGGAGTNYSSNFGTNVGVNGLFGGGGGGGAYSGTDGTGGTGGGGSATAAGVANTGGGGGAGVDNQAGAAGAGGSGIIIIKYEDPAITADTTVYIYTGDPNATNANNQAIMDAQFYVADHWDNGTLDTNKWALRQGAISIASSSLELTGTTGTYGYISGNVTNYPNWTYGEVRFKAIGSDTTPGNTIALYLSYTDSSDYIIWSPHITNANELLFWTQDESVATQSTLTACGNAASHIWRILWASGSAKGYMDVTSATSREEETLKVTHTTNVPNEPSTVIFQEQTTATGVLYIDWLFVRFPTNIIVNAITEDMPDISSTPSSHDFGKVAPSSTYWAGVGEPGWPLADGNCTGNVTNNSSFAVDISFSMGNLTGGATWAIGSSPGSNVFTMEVCVSGCANIGNCTALSATPQALITNLPAATSEYWEFAFYTPTNADYNNDQDIEKSGTITLAAEAA